MREARGALVDLQQDGTRYFDLHHTNNDTLDKIDPVQLRQNVAVWTAVVGVLANHPGAAHQALLLPDWGPTTYFSQGRFAPDADTAARLAATTS